MCMSMSANPSWTLMNLFSYSCYSCEGRCFPVWENSSSKLFHSASSVSDGQSCYKEAAISLQKLRMNKILQKKVVTEIATTGLFLLVYSVSSSISALQGLHLISVSGHLSLIPHFRPGSFFLFILLLPLSTGGPVYLPPACFVLMQPAVCFAHPVQGKQLSKQHLDDWIRELIIRAW